MDFPTKKLAQMLGLAGENLSIFARSVRLLSDSLTHGCFPIYSFRNLEVVSLNPGIVDSLGVGVW